MTHGCYSVWVCYLSKSTALTLLAPLLDVLVHVRPVTSLSSQSPGDHGPHAVVVEQVFGRCLLLHDSIRCDDTAGHSF